MLPMGEDRSATPDAKKRDERARERANERVHALVVGERWEIEREETCERGTSRVFGCWRSLVGHGRTVGHRKAERNNYYLRPIGARQD